MRAIRVVWKEAPFNIFTVYTWQIAQQKTSELQNIIFPHYALNKHDKCSINHFPKLPNHLSNIAYTI